MNLSKNSTKIPTSNMTEETWHTWRAQGVGGSEIGALLGLSKFQSPLELFLRKIGEDVYPFDGNVFTKAGQHDEDLLRFRAQYFEVGGDTMKMWENIEAGKKVRNTKAYPFMVFSKDYPYLFANVDGKCYERNGEKLLLEIKTTSSYASRNYIGGLNPTYLCQVQLYMMILGLDKALIFQRVDGIEYEMYEIPADDEFQQTILDKATEFWMAVTKAKMIKIEHRIDKYYGRAVEGFDESQWDALAELQTLEPDLVGSDSELAFIRDMVKPTEEQSRCVGTDVELHLAHLYLEYQAKAKDNKAAMNKVTAEIILSLGGSHEMIWLDSKDREIKLSYKPDARGRNRLYVSPKLMEKNLSDLTT